MNTRTCSGRCARAGYISVREIVLQSTDSSIGTSVLAGNADRRRVLKLLMVRDAGARVASAH